MRIAVTAVLLAGCVPQDPCKTGVGACIDLTVTSMQISSIDTLRITGGGAISGEQDVNAGHAVKLPTDVPVGLPDTAGGTVELFVEGVLAGTLVGGGTVSANINAGDRPHVTVDIEPNPVMPDFSSPDLAFPIDTACADVAHSRCSRTAVCSTGAPSFIYRFWGDEPTCETRVKLECMAEATAPGTSLDGAQLELCAKGYAAQVCADRFAGYRPTDCVVKGTRSNGMGCFYDSQCSSGFCNLPGGSACGSCATASVAGVTACASSSDCSGRQTCAANVCQLRVALNQTCSASKPCDEELSCVGTTCQQDGASSGVNCDSTSTTLAVCDGDLGLYCNTTSNKCAMASTATVANPACGIVGGVRIYCTNGADCFAGMCKQPSADGASCDVNNGPTCRSPARCIGNVCKLPAPSTCN
jgi:hypothetical protein